MIITAAKFMIKIGMFHYFVNFKLKQMYQIIINDYSIFILLEIIIIQALKIFYDFQNPQLILHFNFDFRLNFDFRFNFHFNFRFHFSFNFH